MRFSAGNDRGGKPRWWLYGDNGQTVAVSGESFDSIGNAKRAAQGFKISAGACKYDIYADAAEQFRWRALATNGRNIASSGEAFASRANAQRAADNVKANAGRAAGP